MILTITLNTSIDKAYRLTAPLEVGTVMRVDECTDSAGGKGLNTSRAIASCGEEVLACGFVGGHTGALFCDLLARDHVQECFVRVASETRSCINVLEPNGRSTEFLEPGRPVTEDDFTELLERVRREAVHADVVTMNGSIPQGLPIESWAHLVSCVRELGVPVVLDSSGDALIAALEARPTVIKPNVDEVSQLAGHRVMSADDAARAAQRVHERGIRDVIVSLGADGALLVCDDGLFRGRSPAIDVLNPVGSGDTLVGAYAVGMARNMTAPERLRFALSRATANCLSPETGHFDVSTADELLAQTHVEQMV